jgi:hypothetical protein
VGGLIALRFRGLAEEEDDDEEEEQEEEEEEEEEEEGVAGNCVWFDMQKATLGPLLAWPEKDKE